MHDMHTYLDTCIDDYRLVNILSQQKSYTSFLGESISSPGQTAVIKFFSTTSLLTEEMRDIFLQYTRKLQKLRHPHIAPLVTSGLHNDTLYAIMTHVKGDTLQDRLKKQEALPQKQALALLEQIGGALYYVHQQHIVHGNVKASAIVFDVQHGMLLTDFALPLPDSDEKKVRWFALSTTGSLPIVHTGHDTAPADDQYALACLAYELFTGQRPFSVPSSEEPGKFYKTRKLVPPTHHNPALSKHIEHALLRALEQDPTKRYADIRAFLDDLGAFFDVLAGEHIPLGISTLEGAQLLAPDSLIHSATDEQPVVYAATSPSPHEDRTHEIPAPLAVAALSSDVPSVISMGSTVPLALSQAPRTFRWLPEKDKSSHRRRIWFLLGLTIALIVVLVTFFFQGIAGLLIPPDFRPTPPLITDNHDPEITATTTLSGTMTATPVPENTPTPTPTVPPTPEQTPTSTPTSPAQVTPTVGVTPTGTNVEELSCKVSVAKDVDWGLGYRASVSITNTGSQPINGWQLTGVFDADQKVTQSWGSSYAQQGNVMQLTNDDGNATIESDQTASNIGFNVSYRDSNKLPAQLQVNGQLCTS